jgi:hypothetical protein
MAKAIAEASGRVARRIALLASENAIKKAAPTAVSVPVGGPRYRGQTPIPATNTNRADSGRRSLKGAVLPSERMGYRLDHESLGSR